jgi:hypothetical protein
MKQDMIERVRMDHYQKERIDQPMVYPIDGNGPTVSRNRSRLANRRLTLRVVDELSALALLPDRCDIAFHWKSVYLH